MLCDRFLARVEEGVFPGGCFFASAAAEHAMLAEANGLFLLRGDPRAFEMARRAIEARLG
jgi:hypothetical protein